MVYPTGCLEAALLNGWNDYSLPLEQGEGKGRSIQLTPELRIEDCGRDTSFGREIYTFAIYGQGKDKFRWLIGSGDPENAGKWMVHLEGILNSRPYVGDQAQFDENRIVRKR